MIWLLRHADAVEGSPDEARPLTEAGAVQARAAGLALARLGVKLDLCLSSPKVRAIQTARLACEPLELAVTAEPRLAGEPFEIGELAAGVENVLLVGHDPSISLSVHTFTGAQVRIKKGALAAVAKGELIALLRPLEIAAIAAATQVPV